MHNKAEVGVNGKPDIVLTYNKTKSGVDAMDQMTHIHHQTEVQTLADGVLFQHP